MSKKGIQVTDFSTNYLQPDRWNKMCVAFAKDIFMRKNSSEKLTYSSVPIN